MISNHQHIHRFNAIISSTTKVLKVDLIRKCHYDNLSITNTNNTIVTPAKVQSRGELTKGTVFFKNDWIVKDPIQKIVSKFHKRILTKNDVDLLIHEEKQETQETEMDELLKKQKMIALLKVQSIIRKQQREIRRKEKLRACKEDRYNVQYTTVVPKKVIKPIKVPLKPIQYVPYFLTNKFGYFKELPDIFPHAKINSVFLHLKMEKSSNLNVNQFVSAISKSCNDENKGLIVVIPKIFAFGDINPRNVTPVDYLNSFSSLTSKRCLAIRINRPSTSSTPACGL